MRFLLDSGLWTSGPPADAAPLTAVLEVSGAVLSWTIDRPDTVVHLAFTDPTRADWLWRLVGERGHTEIVPALGAAFGEGRAEVEGVILDAVALEPLRRLALGHWLRRWWPASRRDGIVELDSTILDGELALLAAAAEGFFADDTFDSDVAELLRPHMSMLNGLAGLGDPRVAELAAACAELAEDLGVGAGSPIPAPTGRADYALVAGADGARGGAEAIATGVASVSWGAVPPGVFDAAEQTITWRVEADGEAATAVVRTELSGPGSPTGIPVRFSSGGVGGTGSLDPAGTATLALLDADSAPVTETVAWNRDWRQTAVTIGADIGEDRAVRDRVRAFARTRLRQPDADAFLAEILAAESDY
ncbi:hypothetical protein C6A85_000000116230 [Mycobacterium sp. ITM-2017-0098]|nr:hypothetical protein C6A85_000000116230 [Mycobacterium sp. ITM-2017-0098]